ncbi:MAG: MmgE/PrpD family protein [Alphaproteobacteria bacterium]|jgi:2-methylcitrate dehydratase PrpD|nr:MmgE/PrpD family protein [Alphaproteobacteria bacterium]
MISAQLADYVAGVTYEQLPASVSERAKQLVLDITGIALRARHDAESTPSLIAATERLGLAGGNASVIGDGARYAPPAAALINGTLAHSLDFDDTHAAASLHAGAPIVPAALAAAEMAEADGATTLAAIIAGFEVQIRISKALGPLDHYDRGFHPTATCGVFGAAAAAGRIFGLSASKIASAFGICASQAAGSLLFLADGAWTKRSQVGAAAMTGLVAACLAREGFKGSAETLDGERGFLKSYAPRPDPTRVVSGLGIIHETLDIAVKPYPCCRYSHGGIDGALALRAAHAIAADDVVSVDIGLSAAGHDLVGAPEAQKQHPQNVVDGQFSMPFLAAVALRDGAMTWASYDRHLGDEESLALCRRIYCQAESGLEGLQARVAVHTGHGSFETVVETPKGEPDAFPTAAELRAKFDGLVGDYLPPARGDALATALLSLEEQASIADVLALTRSDRPVAMEAAS